MTDEIDTKSGRWSKKEHQLFIEGVSKFGRNWKKIEEHIGTRNGPQIRSHAQKFFLKLMRQHKSIDEVTELSIEMGGGGREEGGKGKEEDGGRVLVLKNLKREIEDILKLMMKRREEEEEGRRKREEEERKRAQRRKEEETITDKEGRKKEVFGCWMKEEDDWRKEDERRVEKEVTRREEFECMKDDGWIREDEDGLSLEEIDKLSNFFLAYMFCIELVVQEGENGENESETLECRDIYYTDSDNNKSFLYLLIKCLELYSEECKPIERFRKLSDFVRMDKDEEEPMVMPRKSSFQVCNHLEDKQRKVESLRRKNSLVFEGVIEKKLKIL